jgi:predicted Na+-dependent transporter
MVLFWPEYFSRGRLLLCPEPSNILMMVMLFLAFVKISPADVGRALMSNWAGMIWGSSASPGGRTGTWRIGLPLAWYPPLALPILLLAGASTGVSSPFFTSLCRGNISYCLVMAVVTSLILPISLPINGKGTGPFVAGL